MNTIILATLLYQAATPAGQTAQSQLNRTNEILTLLRSEAMKRKANAPMVMHVKAKRPTRQEKNRERHAAMLRWQAEHEYE